MDFGVQLWCNGARPESRSFPGQNRVMREAANDKSVVRQAINTLDRAFQPSTTAVVPPSPSTAANDARASAVGQGATGAAASASPHGGAAGPSFSPLYQQIKSLILRSLQSGEWRPGEAIPREIEPAPRRPAVADGATGAPASASPPGVPAGPSSTPLYQQIKALILRSLQSGEWRPGEAIPSEIELAARFKVSQGTVRKAVDELAAENL